MNDADVSGFTLVELLVSLAVTAMIASFAIGGLTVTLRIYAGSQQSDSYDAIEAGLTRLKTLISQAKPATTLDPEMGLARLLFEGRQQSLEFVTLSEGFAIEGGLVRAGLKLNCSETISDRCRLEVQTGVYRSDVSAVAMGEPTILLRHVKSFNLYYFGAPKLGKLPLWSDEWISRDELPLAAKANVEVDRNGTLNGISLIIPLHNVLP